MDNRTYDILKWVALVALPAIAVFILALDPIWDIPNAEKVALTVVAVEVLLGSLLGVSSEKYKKQRKIEQETIHG